MLLQGSICRAVKAVSQPRRSRDVVGGSRRGVVGGLVRTDRRGPSCTLGTVGARRVRAVALVAAALAIFAYIARFHEFWRDEAQTALVARAVPLAELLPAMRREGVPPVVYLVLKVGLVLPPPYSLAALGALGFASLLFGTYALLFTICRSPTKSAVATAALAFTDTYSYELGVVVRQYGLGLGFALACVAYLGRAIASDERRDARLGAVFGALAVSTSVHPGCLAGSALLAYSVERLVLKRTVRSIVEPLCTVPAYLFTFFLIAPYDRAPELLIVFHRTFASARDLLASAFLDGSVCLGWWTPQNIDGPRHWIAGLTGAGLLGVAALELNAMRRHPRLTAFYAPLLLLNAATLSYIFVVRNPGMHRHHLFLFVPWLVIALGLLLRSTDRRGLARALVPVSAAMFLPWFAFEYWTAGVDLASDVRGAFSGTKAAAAMLPPGARVVSAGEDWFACGILFWRPDVSMRAQSSKGRPFRYLFQDWEWHRVVPLLPLLTEECRGAQEIYVLAAVDAPLTDTSCTRTIATPSSMLPTERFSVNSLSCSCLQDVVASSSTPR